MARYLSPDTEQAFERFCLELLREHWKNPELQLYGSRGEAQFGVDIYDPTFSKPFKGAQCKQHKPHMSMPPEEIREEVAKALKFEPPLERYVILTTAKASTNADNAIISINKQHREEGKFLVSLMNWDRDIEPLLDNYRSVAELLITYSGGHLTQIHESIQAIKTGITASFSLEAASMLLSKTAIDSDLDVAEQLAKAYDYDGARSSFERIERHHGDALNARQKYRVLVGMAGISFARGIRDEAGGRLLAAAKLLPEDERARVNEVLGYELSGDERTAYELAGERLTEQPISTKLTACRVRTAPIAFTFDELEAIPSTATSGDIEVCIAMAIRANALGRYADAERYARTAVAADPGIYNPKALLGQALLNQEAIKLEQSIWEGGISLDLDRLKEAVRVLDDAISLARAQKQFHSLPDSFLLRAQAKVLLQDIAGAEQDFEEAIHEEPQWTPPYRRYAHFLMQCGRKVEAATSLRRAVRYGSDVESKYMLASLLSGLDDAASRSEATGIFIELAHSVGPKSSDEISDFSPRRPHSVPTAAFHAAIEDLAREGRFADADEFIDKVPEDNVHRLGRLTARSRLSLARGDTVAASTQIDEALTLVALPKPVCIRCHRHAGGESRSRTPPGCSRHPEGRASGRSGYASASSP